MRLRPPLLASAALATASLFSAVMTVSFTASASDIVLIEGPSGSGKSSVFAALRGAAGYGGTISLHGSDASTLSPAEWLAWAGQQPGLIAGTIADNVSLGHAPDAAVSMELVRRALDLACASDLDPATELGVQGAGLSGGQAQRVAIARAIHRFLSGRERGANSVIALDEPTSALDAETEHQLWASLKVLAAEGALILLISHRRSARDIATQVVAIGTEVTA